MHTPYSPAAAGFTYHWELERPDGTVDRWVDKNLLPTEVLNYMLSTAFRDGAKQSSWYVAIYEGNYTPTADVTAATFPSLATECTSYSAATRPAYVSSAPAGGSIDNAASRAEFTATADKTIYGGALVSAATKGSTSGVLGSIVRFASPKPFVTGSVLRCTAGAVITSL